MPFKTLFSALIFIGLTSAIEAQDLSGDPVEGKKIAVQWCATCHDVSPDQNTAQDGIISFMQIAMLKDVSLGSLIAIQSMPHQPMLDFDLSRKAKRDIATYILTLKDK